MGHRRRCRGFTLIELIMVLVITGILAVFVFPIFNDTAVPERAFRDGVLSAVAHARRSAVASRHFTCVTLTTGTGNAARVAVTRDLNDPDALATVTCSTPVALPGADGSCGGANNQVCAPANVTLGTLSGVTTLVFDPLGRLVTAAAPKTVAGSAATITVSNQPNITVQAETGYVQ